MTPDWQIRYHILPDCPTRAAVTLHAKGRDRQVFMVVGDTKRRREVAAMWVRAWFLKWPKTGSDVDAADLDCVISMAEAAALDDLYSDVLRGPKR